MFFSDFNSVFFDCNFSYSLALFAFNYLKVYLILLAYVDFGCICYFCCYVLGNLLFIGAVFMFYTFL